MPTVQTVDSLTLAQKYRNVLFSSFWEAARIVAEACGVYPKRPLNIPLNWKVEIAPHYGLKYINPVDQEEWVKVIPPTLESRQRFSQYASVIYHKPIKKILKRFGMKSDPEVQMLKDVQEFDQTNQDHLRIIDDLVKETKNSGLLQRSVAAGRWLKKFWISIDDLLLIRRKLGFKNFADVSDFKELLKKIKDELLCDCFGTYISSSQLGAISKYNLDHHRSLRLAFHFDEEKPFVKISIDGAYRKADGSIIYKGETEAHIDFSTFLQGKFDWFQPKCKVLYSFSEFDYTKVSHPIDEELRKGEKQNRLIDYKNSKGVGYA